jgi:hypothetical protein
LELAKKVGIMSRRPDVISAAYQCAAWLELHRVLWRLACLPWRAEYSALLCAPCGVTLGERDRSYCRRLFGGAVDGGEDVGPQFDPGYGPVRCALNIRATLRRHSFSGAPILHGLRAGVDSVRELRKAADDGNCTFKG